ncbi:MAG: diguanylate cyclase [Nitratireductor sp.]|nr:diguanylate cyclase [Nitratireductor sp.]
MNKAIGGSTGTARIWIASALIAILFLATLAFSIFTSSSEANRFALHGQKQMVAAEIQRLIEQAVTQQAEIAHWDEAYDKLIAPVPDTGFARKEIVDWMLADYGFTSAFILRPQHSVIEFSDEGMKQSKQTFPAFSDLEALARERFLANADRVERNPSSASAQFSPAYWHAAAARMIGGRPSLVIAQALVPDIDPAQAIGRSRLDGVPVMIAVKPITGEMLAAIAQRHNFFSPVILPAGRQAALPAEISLPDESRQSSLILRWIPKAPRPVVLRHTLPAAGGMTLLFLLFLGLLTRRHADALKRLAESEAIHRYNASHDALTGLANRLKFDAELDARFAAGEDAPFALFCIDLDRFKPVNDQHGHEAGDAVLREIARRFAAVLGERGLVARVGGDEFVAIVDAFSDRDELCWLADRMVEAASRPVPHEDKLLQIGASIGIATAPAPARNAAMAMRMADEALYSAKGAGRGRASLGGLDQAA